MRTAFFMPVILVTLLAALASTTRSGLAEAAADECLTKPGASAPQGSHWYYRVDRANNNRHCWYLGSEGAKPRATKQQAEAPARPRARTISRSEPSTADGPAVEIADAEGAQGALAPAAPPLAVPPPPGTDATTESDNSAAVEVAARWHQLPGSADATVSGAAPPSNSYVEERAPAQSEGEMPLVWPILTPAEAAEPASPAASLEYVLGLLVGALALAAAIARLVFVLCAARERRLAEQRSQRIRQLNVPRPQQPAPAYTMPDPVAFAPPEVRRSAAALRHKAVAGDLPRSRQEPRRGQLDKPSDPAHDLEESLLRLLQAWQRAAA